MTEATVPETPETLVAADLARLAERNPAPAGGVSPALAHRGEGIQIRQIAFDAGAVLPEHTAPHPIVVHVLDGSIAFRVEDRVHELGTGGVLHVPAGVRHEVTARRPARITVTLLG